MLEEARRRGEGEFRAMDAARLELRDDSFDVATAVTVIQHLEPSRQGAAVAELVRVVRPGGFVLAVDRVGKPDAFSSAHGTFPRPRDEWHRLWGDAGAELVDARGQEFSYPLALARLGRGGTSPGAAGRTERRGGSGWRRYVLDALVAASYPTELVAERIPRAPATHVAALYRVG